MKDSKKIKERKVLAYSLVGLFSVLVILAAVFGIMIYQHYQETLLQTRKILEAQKQYEAKNFDNKEFNYIEVTGSKEVRPGEAIDLKIHFKNTGFLTAKDLQIRFSIPENVELVESLIGDYKYEVKDSLVVLPLGNLPPESTGDINIGFRVNSPLPDGTKISVPDLKFIYIKEAPLLGKKDIFNQDIDNEEVLTVVASPDFSRSRISIEDQGDSENKQDTVTYGDSIIYRIEIINSGDMDAEEVRVAIRNLDNLTVAPDDNPDFQIIDKEAVLNVDSLKAGERQVFDLVAYIDKTSANNSVILPVLDIACEDSAVEFKAPERTVKLYPDFKNSNIFLTARGAGGIYSGDVIDVTVNVKNSGNIEAQNVIAKLVYSNLFALEQGDSQWVIERLAVGEAVTFNSSLRITAELEKDTSAFCALNISSDEMQEIQAGSASILISGEKPFTSNLIPIVAIHGVEPNPSGRYELSTGQFDALCGTLKSFGYKTVTLMDLLAYLEGRKQLPEKPVIITSDDGYQSIYTSAFPILQKYGYRMTVFLATGFIGNSNEDRKLNDFDGSIKGIPARPMLIWPEVAAMSGYGIEFQSHGVNHKNIGSISDSDAYFELAQSKSDIESHIGRPCAFVAWPHSSYSSYAISILSGIGYRGALVYGGGVENVSSMYVYKMKRIPIYQETPPSGYADVMGLY